MGLSRLKAHSETLTILGGPHSEEETQEPEVRSFLTAENVNLEEVSESYTLSFKNNVLQKLHDLTPAQFEHFASFLLKAFGFQRIVVTGKSGDGGIDGHGQLKVGMAVLKAAFSNGGITQSGRKKSRPFVERYKASLNRVISLLRPHSARLPRVNPLKREPRRSSFLKERRLST